MRNLYLEVTARILAELKAGVVPWRQPWSTTPGRNTPCNGATNRRYNGTNVVLLWMAMRDHKWSTARFVTFKQALELGGHVRKGEHGTKIYFVKDLKFADENEVDGDDEATLRSVRMLREYPIDQVTVMGKTARHPSSPELLRVFCPTCGTRLFAERPSASRVGIALAAFDHPNALPPECHFFVSSKIGWVRLNDDLPQYPEWPPG